MNPADKPKEACGVVGVFAPGAEVAKLTYYALFALQHRGQESAGIAVSEGERMVVYKDMGLVAQVFDENTLNCLPGNLSIGHVRYSTTGSSLWDNAQPIYREGKGLSIALGHNGNLVNTLELVSEMTGRDNGGMPSGVSTDSDVIAEMIVKNDRLSVEDSILEVLPKLKGAFTLVMMDERTVFGARDPHGLRPLAIGRLSEGYVLASETCALDAIGATFLREVDPGEMVAIDENGLRSHRYSEATPALCIFEFAYFARPDSLLNGRSVQKSRYQMGARLAEESPVDADLVMPVPDSGRGAAAGFSQGSGIPYVDGFVKNSYVGRTFIQPAQAIRNQGIGAKLNPIAHLIEGKRLIVVDDSIVRGSTTRQIVRMLRNAGAREVHMRIASPPIRWPCFYGIDTADKNELIASAKTPEQIRDFIEADSLSYLSLEGMVAATEIERDKFCTACFSSEYPIPVPEELKVTKHMLETAKLEAPPR